VQNKAFDPKGGTGGLGRLDPHAVQICSCPSAPEREGRRLDELAEDLGLSPRDCADQLLQEDGQSVIVALHQMDEGDVRRVMAHPTTMIGSDGIPALDGKPHPRLYGTFPRVLGHYARDEGVLPLAEAVHRMTGFPAEKFQLKDRGVIRVGAFADLVLFDPAKIRDTATFDDPHRPAAGRNRRGERRRAHRRTTRSSAPQGRVRPDGAWNAPYASAALGIRR
jgi:N-acyl-D-aspartate/D-glutamate deacylase